MDDTASPAKKGQRSTRITDQAWEMHKTELASLWPKHTLLEIRSHMKDKHGFAPTKRQYGYRLNEKWGWKKYTGKRDPASPSSQNEAPAPTLPGALQPESSSHLHPAYCSSTHINVHGTGLLFHTPSNASETSTGSANASFNDDTDAEETASLSNTPHLATDYAWGPQDDAKKLVADFCFAMSDGENASALYVDLHNRLPMDVSAVVKSRLVTYICRAADQPAHMKVARKILSQHQASVYGTTEDQLFLILNGILDGQEDPEGRSHAPTTTPIPVMIKPGGGLVLQNCFSWCARQLTLRLTIPREVASISFQRSAQWHDNIKLYCTLWHKMLELVLNGTKPPWYGPCESEVGISPSELLVNVCWMIGEEARHLESSDILQRARDVADTMTRRPPDELLGKLCEKFSWMNQVVQLRGPDEAFDLAVRQKTRHYITTIWSMPLPYPAEGLPLEPSLSTSANHGGSGVVYRYQDEGVLYE